MKTFFPFLFIAATLRSPAGAAAPVSFVHSSGNRINGITEDGTDSFLGIQYAKVGARFSRSSIIALSDSPLDINATGFGPDCHQGYPEVASFLRQPRVENEECLYLNVWRPANTPSSELLPIMVWIHGGGFMLGSGADEVYNGAGLARNERVMVINMNYRLGALGFLPQDMNGTGAMNGLYDQIMALTWIQQNANEFGGDPNRVTLVGESAGSEATCMLAVSPLTKGLFQRAIMQSGDCRHNPWMIGVPSEDIAFGLSAVTSLMNSTGVSSLEELQNPSMVDAATLNYMSAAVGWSIVIVDKEILPQHPRELYLDSHNIVPTDFLVGSNSVEDLTFMMVTPDHYLELAETGLEESVYTLIGSKYGNKTAMEALDAYDAEKYYANNAVAAFSQFHSDWYIGCPTRTFASQVAPLVSGNVYLYNFSHFSITDPSVHFGLSDKVDNSSWASHMAEIPFVFGTLEAWLPSFANESITEEDWAMSREVMSRWANFAKTGVPSIDSGAGGEDWTPISSHSVTVSRNNLRKSQGDSYSDLPVLVFEAGTSQMEDLPLKSQQCAVYPYGQSASAGQAANNEEDQESDIVAAASEGSTRMPGMMFTFVIAYCSLVMI